MLTLPNMPAVQYDTVVLSGGLDQVTSAYQLPPGALRDCVNFACRPNGGYYRIPGYERIDGGRLPSEGVFFPITYTLLPGKTIEVGDFTNFNIVCYVDPFNRYFAITSNVLTADEVIAKYETFVPMDIIRYGEGGVPEIIGYATGAYANLTIKELAIGNAAAANILRGLISVVPGSGPILGVFYYNDDIFAFRNTSDGTRAALYRSDSITGFAQVFMGSIVHFSGMSVIPSGLITQGTKLNIVVKTLITSGDLTAGDAAGYFVMGPVPSDTFSPGVATYTGGSVMITVGTAPITLSPNGKYNFDVGSFSGSEKVYGADGVNDAFEFDGVTYVPLIIPDIAKPKYPMVHSNHLFLSIGTSIIHSAIGNPYNYEVILGAGEIAAGADVTGMLVVQGNQNTAALMVFSRNSTHVLYGTSAADWNFVSLNKGVGAWDRTAQNLFDAFALDDRGVTMMKQSLNYGNFDSGTLTFNIRQFILAQQGKATCSSLNRQNNQYRVFFNNGYGLYCTTKPEGFVGHGVVLYPDPPTCCFDASKSDGTNINLFGTESGYVMLNDSGTSFDGKTIPAAMTTNINCVKTPRMRKRFRRAVLEVQAEAYVEMQVGYSFEWANPNILPHVFVDGEGFFSRLPFWDNMIWDAFFWDGKSDDSISLAMDGTGENVQLMIVTDSDHVAEFTLPSVIFHYTPRRGNR